MKLAAASAIAEIVTEEERNPEYVIPSVFDVRSWMRSPRPVANAAQEEGVARRAPGKIEGEDAIGRASR